MKALAKYGGIVLAILSVLSLGLPLFSTTLATGEAGRLVVRGYNLVEFSPWGGVAVMVPMVLLGLALSKLNRHVKTMGLLGLCVLTGFALCGAVTAAQTWVRSAADGFVKPHMCHWIYALLLFFATLCFYVENNGNWEECPNEDWKLAG